MLPLCDLQQAHFSGRVFFLHFNSSSQKIANSSIEGRVFQLSGQTPAGETSEATTTSRCQAELLVSPTSPPAYETEDSATPSSASVSIFRLNLLHRFMLLMGSLGHRHPEIKL